MSMSAKSLSDRPPRHERAVTRKLRQRFDAVTPLKPLARLTFPQAQGLADRWRARISLPYWTLLLPATNVANA
jgi:hypothetical protein